MIRSASFLVVALTAALWVEGAHAQASNPDLLSRIDRLEQALRDLTGTVEQLQYRNQQLEQQLRRLQDAEVRPEGSRAATAAPPRPPVGAALPGPAPAPSVPAAVASAGPPERSRPLPPSNLLRANQLKSRGGGRNASGSRLDRTLILAAREHG